VGGIIMNIYKRVEPYKVSNERGISKAEMSISQTEFLCGLIRDYRPQKIVEVGIAAGGTTINILKCISELGLPCTMYSVDLAEHYYRNKTLRTGFLVDEWKGKNEKWSFHHMMLGKVLPERLDEIGDNIDFLILDTVHLIPGEILDFLAVFPYLSEHAIVVLHDTALHHHLNNSRCIATCTLFSTVTADKFVNDMEYYKNIAAFSISKDTETYLMDVFNALTLPWGYLPDDKQLKEYDRIYIKNYSEDAVKLWSKAKEWASKYFVSTEVEDTSLKDVFSLIRKEPFQKIFLYGTGENGRILYTFLLWLGVEIVGFIVSDGRKKLQKYMSLPVYEFSDIPEDDRDALIVQATDSEEVTKLLAESKYEYRLLSKEAWKRIWNFSNY